MTSTYTTSNSFDKPAKGDDVDTWATSWWEPFADCVDDAMDGVLSYANLTGDATLTSTSGVVNQARNRIIWVKAADGNYTLTIPAVAKWYFVINDDANNTVTLARSGGGTSIAVGPKTRAILFCDGTDVFSMSTNGWKYVGSTAAASGTEVAVTLPVGQFNEFMLVGQALSHSHGSNCWLLFTVGGGSAGSSSATRAAGDVTSFFCHVKAGMYDGTNHFATLDVKQTAAAISGADWLAGSTAGNGGANTTGFNGTFNLYWWDGSTNRTFDGSGTVKLFAR